MRKNKMIEKAKNIIHKIKPGLEKYQAIMNRFQKADVSKDSEFQKMYNGFYRVRQRDEEFYNVYYSYMEKSKFEGTDFEKTLIHFYRKLNRIEASFSSKLVATINPEMPIWDAYVLKNLHLKTPPQYSKTRLEDTVILYNEIGKWYSNCVKSKDGKDMMKIFNQSFPNNFISDIKKIDFILWQIRD
jgi:hypothetical protein